MNYKIIHDKCKKEITLNTHEAIGYMDENKTIHAVWDCPECGKEIDGIQMQDYIRSLKRAKAVKPKVEQAETVKTEVKKNQGTGKRYFFHNQTITIKKFPLSITNHGDVYHNSSEGFRKLDSLWQPKLNALNVVLPNDKTIQLSPSKDGLILREAKA